MKLKTTLFATAMTLFALPLMAQDIKIVDAYARASAMMSKSGAAFMVIVYFVPNGVAAALSAWWRRRGKAAA